MTLILECAALVVLLLLSAFFSSAETAMLSLNPIHIHRVRLRNPRAAGQLESMLALPMHLLSTILIGNTLVNVLAASVGFLLADTFFRPHGEAVAIPVMTALLLVFGEVAPKRLAMSRREKLAEQYAAPFVVLIKVVTPLRVGLERIGILFSTSLRPARKSLTEDEFLTVVEVGEEEGVLDEEERTMVDGIIRLEETQASDVMTPRVDLVGIDLGDPPEERERIARSVQFRYLPLYRESIDQPEGFLDVPRLLLSESHDWQSALLPPFFVPETVPLDTLLATFQREHKRVAFVVDEFGGTAGLVTRGDILEEIAPAVDNEYGEEKPPIQKLSEGCWMVDGATSLEDVDYELDLELEAEGADRIAGWVSAMAERIPKTGEVIEAQGCRATVKRARKRRILLVMLEKMDEKDQMSWEDDE